MSSKNKIIDIFGSKWVIKQHKGPIPDKEDPTKTTYYGVASSYDNTITLNSELEDNEFAITLLHELFHAISGTGQYHNTNNDEPQIEFLARALYSLSKQGLITINYGRESTDKNK